MGNQWGAILGIVVGLAGMLYGWKAKYFKSGLQGFSTRPVEKVAPRWQDRALVMGISGVILIGSFVALFVER